MTMIILDKIFNNLYSSRLKEISQQIFIVFCGYQIIKIWAVEIYVYNILIKRVTPICHNR